MSTTESLKKDLQKVSDNQPLEKKKLTIAKLLEEPGIKRRFEETLDKKAPQFMSSIINLVKNTGLKKADPMSVLSSAMIAATLDLPVDPNLGFAWIIPYKDQAQFILGYKGYIQLALRTGQYKNINAIPVYEGQLKKWNPLTEEIELEFEDQTSDMVIGYAATFELINGFRKTVYWSKDQVIKHKNKFSKSGFVWNQNFDAMALKTLLRNLLSKWGILSIDMQRAAIADENPQARFNPDNEDEIWNVSPEEDEAYPEQEEEVITVIEEKPIPNTAIRKEGDKAEK